MQEGVQKGAVTGTADGYSLRPSKRLLPSLSHETILSVLTVVSALALEASRNGGFREHLGGAVWPGYQRV